MVQEILWGVLRLRHLLNDTLVWTHRRLMLCFPTPPLPLPQRKQSIPSRPGIHLLQTEIAQLLIRALHLLPQQSLDPEMSWTIMLLLHPHGELGILISQAGLNHPRDNRPWASSCNRHHRPVCDLQDHKFLAPPTFRTL